MGAAAGAVAAIHARRIREILDAYRTAPATSAGAARTPAELGLDEHERQLEELVAAHVLQPGARAGSYFLEERSYIAYRDGRKRRKLSVIAAGVVILLLIALVSALMTGNP